MRMAGPLGVLSIALLMTHVAARMPRWPLVAALVLYGGFTGIVQPAVDATFADALFKNDT